MPFPLPQPTSVQAEPHVLWFYKPLCLKLALVIFPSTGNDFVGFGSEGALSPEPAKGSEVCEKVDWGKTRTLTQFHCSGYITIIVILTALSTHYKPLTS